VGKTLYDPPIDDVVAHITQVMEARGVAISRVLCGVTAWDIGDKPLQVFWSHAEQRVMLYYPKAIRTGKFKHLSLLKCSPKVYFARITDWITRNVEVSGEVKQKKRAVPKELSHEQKMAKNGWVKWDKLDDTGWYWWWDGDMDALPVPVYLDYTLTDCMHFATAGQHGWRQSQLVSTMGGWWNKLTAPAVINPGG
jgi:hypothetical protein